MHDARHGVILSVRNEVTNGHGARHGIHDTMAGMTYDTSRLTQLGKKHQRLRAELEALRPELAEEIQAAAAAGVPQVEIVRASGYTRDQVRQISLPPERRRVRRTQDA